MTTYCVETPKYTYTEYIDYWIADQYEMADWEEVEAPTRREAISIAVRQWLRQKDSYCAQRKSDALCPWTGVRAKTWDEIKAETKAAGPPEQRDNDECWWCQGEAFTYLWVDRMPDTADEEQVWGWFPTCGRCSA